MKVRTTYDPSMSSPGPRGRRIGLLGGTFDPPHVGHLVTAVRVREALALDVVLLVVANEPWQKVGSREVTAAPQRLEMVRAAVRGEPGLEASDVEIRRGGPSYTVDTLEELRSGEPGCSLVVVLGSDAAARMRTWHRADELGGLCELAVVDRPGADPVIEGQLPAGLTASHVDVPRLEVSSTDLRARAASGRSLRYLVPDAVISLIREGDLYGDRR